MKWIKLENATLEQLSEELLGINSNGDILLGYYCINESVDKIPIIEMDSVWIVNPTHIIPKSE